MEYWIVGPQVRAPSISQEWSWELFRLTNIIQISEPFRPSTPGWWLAYVYGPWYISAMRFYVYGGATPPSFALGFRVYMAEHHRPRSPMCTNIYTVEWSIATLVTPPSLTA